MAAQNRKFRLKLPCGSIADFDRRYASRFSRDFFVPTDKSLAPNEIVDVQLVLTTGELGRHGKAIVMANDTQKGKTGLLLRFQKQADGLLAQSDPDRVLDFEEANPTRPSIRSQQIAEAIRDEPDIVIEMGPLTPAPPLPKQVVNETADTTEANLDGGMEDDVTSPPQVQSQKPTVERPESDVQTPALAPTSFEAVPTPVVEDRPYLAPPSPKRQKTILAVVAVLAASGLAFILFTQGRSSPDSVEIPSTAKQQANESEAAVTRLAVAKAISTADSHLAAGRLTGPESALQSLLKAKSRFPSNSGITTRLTALADTFEQLAASALNAENLAEAATHFQAVLLADPSRTAAATQMREIEKKILSRQKDK